jgi:2-keto-4-pentenoate hydratase/2-oxohepta-3-ene-1,7-dioic acid hydratase in catechol pathway
MKLVRYGTRGAERPGLIDPGGNIRDLSSYIPDIDANVLGNDKLRWLAGLEPAQLPLIPAGTRLGQPISNVRKCICTGPNYYKMSQESGARIPEEPRLYMKADTSITGPYEDVVLPAWATTAHWEVEIAVVMGAAAWEVPEERVMDHVAGYAIVNDIVDHEAQTVGDGESVKGRSAPGFGPLGPWLVTKDEIVDVQNLHIWLEVDGQRFTEGNSSDMVFKVPYLVSYISGYMALRPGDVICTGTPGGVGRKSTPPLMLRAGHIMRLGIEGLGEQRTCVV